MRDRLDFQVLREKHWYRIPVETAERYLHQRWPPEWLAFYMTKIFGSQAYSVSYFGRIVRIRKVLRTDLFPNEPMNEKSERQYYQVFIERLDKLAKPIPSKRLRRFVFIPTTWKKVISAGEINDLFDDSPLEDSLWDGFKERGVDAERQESVSVANQRYFLDFAIYCTAGKLDVETDGDVWHANPQRAAVDNVRDNALQAAGWTVLRFGSAQVREQMEEYCLSKVVQTVNRLGGIAHGEGVGRTLPQLLADGSYQMDMFSRSEIDFD